ncbi:hypothetical protein AUR64_16085 [Haloprofundus marisrubri]|uniref:Uncharacterized protein n=1 Tax=Haloprofundus marisrubri TaxID=1514971 RepID=A0A0W1R8K6_9EURY|nr:hypothetical protein [Haloprofundus marisrubri]KTG09300.1 hypothetical protein AUR64_16085 [Haloprofundus marisrubri]
MIVVATEDFELYHEAVAALRERGVTFTTVRSDDDLPAATSVLVTAPDDTVSDLPSDVTHIETSADEVRQAVEEALTVLRGSGERTIVGVDPGTRPGIAVLSGEMVVAAFQVPLSDAVAAIRRETDDAVDPLVRVGDGARLQSAQIVNDLEDVPVELVDETGTTPYLGTGARGMGDVLAAVNIAHLEGERVDSRDIDPTAGEIQVIKDRSREQSPENRSIDESLARRVAAGELSIEEALAEHRGEGDENNGGDKGGEGGETVTTDSEITNATDGDESE